MIRRRRIVLKEDQSMIRRRRLNVEGSDTLLPVYT